MKKSIFINKDSKTTEAPTPAHRLGERIYYMVVESGLTILEQQGAIEIAKMGLMNRWLKIIDDDKGDDKRCMKHTKKEIALKR